MQKILISREISNLKRRFLFKVDNQFLGDQYALANRW